MSTFTGSLSIRPLSNAVRLAFVYAALPLTIGVTSTARAQTTSPDATENVLPAVKVQATKEPLPGDFAPAYDGGQIARGAKFGVLGNQEMINVPFSMTSYTSKINRRIRSANSCPTIPACVRLSALAISRKFSSFVAFN